MVLGRLQPGALGGYLNDPEPGILDPGSHNRPVIACPCPVPDFGIEFCHGAPHRRPGGDAAIEQDEQRENAEVKEGFCFHGMANRNVPSFH